MRKLFILIGLLFAMPAFSQCVVDAGANQHICFPGNLGQNIGTLSATVTTGVAPYQIEWKTTYQSGSATLNASDFLSDIHSLNPTLISYTYDDSLVFYIEITDDNGDICTDSTIIGFTPYQVSLDDCVRYVTKGDSVELFVAGFGGHSNMQYLWTPNYNISNTNIANPLVWPDSFKQYDVSGTTEHGCIYTSNCIVVVYGVGIDESKNVAFSLFPNPVSEVINVKLENTENVNYSIIDITGKVIQNGLLNSSTIDVSKLANGIYSLQLSSKDGFLGTAKWIKQ